MEMTTGTKTPTGTNELRTVLAGALQIGREHNLKEICTEAVLYAILDNDTLNVTIRLLKMGFNVYVLKRLLAERLKTKAIINPPGEPHFSVALEGLLILNSIDKGSKNTSMHLLKTIIRNNNTAAARLLKSERLSLTPNNELIYKPIVN